MRRLVGTILTYRKAVGCGALANAKLAAWQSAAAETRRMRQEKAWPWCELLGKMTRRAECGVSGGRYRIRTCDFYRVRIALYR